MRHDSEYFKKIGARLNEAMDEKNVTQRDIAELCGVSITTVHNYIHGIAAPNKKNIQNTAIKNLTCFLQDLFGKSCKVFWDKIACPFWTKLQGFQHHSGAGYPLQACYFSFITVLNLTVLHSRGSF